MAHEVAERVVHPVSLVVGYAERPLIQDLDEAAIAAPVRYVDASLGVAARDEERVGVGD